MGKRGGLSVCMCVSVHSIVVLVIVFTLLDAVAVLLLLVLLLRVGDVPLRVVVQHGLGLVDLQLENTTFTCFSTEWFLVYISHSNSFIII